jgi:hypothetical protein
MRNILRYFTLLSATSFILLATLGGCADINAAMDCEQMCDELRTCIDGDLDVHKCHDRCEDKAESNKLRKQLDSCTDCLDQGYACAEISDHCSACKGVTEALL